MSAVIPNEVMASIATLTADLVRLRQKEDHDLCIEDYAPKVFGNLMDKYLEKQPWPRV